MSLSPIRLKRFLAGLVARPDLWRQLVSHSSDGRIYNQVWDDDAVNAWLICWSEDDDTGFHDHDESAAAIAVIEGQIQEERLRLGTTPRCRVIGPGSTLLIPPTAIHRVRHAGSMPAVSLHAYSPPLRRTGAYRVGSGGELLRAAQHYEQELRPAAAPR